MSNSIHECVVLQLLTNRASGEDEKSRQWGSVFFEYHSKRDKTMAAQAAAEQSMAQATRPLHLGVIGAASTARRHPPIDLLLFRPTGRRRTTSLVAAAKGAAAEVVWEFYEGVNRRDLAAVAPLIAKGCVYEDLVFPRHMMGRDQVVGFFGDFMGSVSLDLRFVIDDISGKDPAAVGVTWHLEWKGRVFPLSRGCNFYWCEAGPAAGQVPGPAARQSPSAGEHVPGTAARGRPVDGARREPGRRPSPACTGQGGRQVFRVLLVE